MVSLRLELPPEAAPERKQQHFWNPGVLDIRQTKAKGRKLR
jgi:hypothetical protein